MWISELECPTQSCYILNGGFYIPGGKFWLRIKEKHNVRNIQTLGFKIRFNGLCSWKETFLITLQSKLKGCTVTVVCSLKPLMIFSPDIRWLLFCKQGIFKFLRCLSLCLYSPPVSSPFIPSQSWLTIICPKAGIGEWRSGATTVGLDSWRSLIGTRWEGSQENKEYHWRFLSKRPPNILFTMFIKRFITGPNMVKIFTSPICLIVDTISC